MSFVKKYAYLINKSIAQVKSEINIISNDSESERKKPSKAERNMTDEESRLMKSEPGDFVATDCHWKHCGLQFPTQRNLVNVSIRLNGQ